MEIVIDTDSRRTYAKVYTKDSMLRVLGRKKVAVNIRE